MAGYTSVSQLTVQSRYQVGGAGYSVDLCLCLCLQLTVQSWRLAWNFTDGEVLAESGDYFPNTSYPVPSYLNTSHVEIQSTSLSADDAQQAVVNAWFAPSQVCFC